MTAVTLEERYPTMDVEKDLKTFDRDAKKLITLMQLAGWRGYRSNKGHAIMHAPDGVATLSISRDSLRGRSGANAKAGFRKWVTDNPEANPAVAAMLANKDRPQPKSTAFGVIPEPPAYWDETTSPYPAELMHELMRNHQVRDFLRDHKGVSEVDVLYAWDEEAKRAKDPHQWAVFDVTGSVPVLVGYGKGTTEAESWEKLHEARPQMFAPTEQVEAAEAAEQGSVDVQQFRCNECGKTFETAAAVNGHQNLAHSRVAAVLKCEVCGREIKGAGPFSRHKTKHIRDAEAALIGAVPKVAKTKAKADVTVAPQAVTDDHRILTGSGDVLIDHLEQLPEGADAEQMIAAVRAIVAAPLVAEIRALRAKVVEQADELATLTKSNGELEAKMSVVMETFNLINT
jgi:hypothetical protein